MAVKTEERQDKAVEMLVKFKSDSAGMKTGMWEQERDLRFITIVIRLMAEFNSGEDVMNWLERPCSCSGCYDLSPQSPRLDLINSVYGSKHLLDQFEADRAAAFGE